MIATDPGAKRHADDGFEERVGGCLDDVRGDGRLAEVQQERVLARRHLGRNVTGVVVK